MTETLDTPPLSPSPIPSPSQPSDHPSPAAVDAFPSPSHADISIPPPTSARTSHPRGKKRRPIPARQRAALQRRLALLSQTLDPKPFLPSPSDSDLSPLEAPLRLLGLWSFATTPLPSDLRRDILTDLIAHYDTNAHRSLVRNYRVYLTRATLAHALALPVKRPDFDDPDRQLLAEAHTASGLVKFLLNYIVLGEEGIIPLAAQAAIEAINAGQAWKVDWAGVMWGMVERDVLEAQRSGVCFYSSHLQQLVRHQKPGVFEEEPLLEVPMAEEEMHNAGNAVAEVEAAEDRNVGGVEVTDVGGEDNEDGDGDTTGAVEEEDGGMQWNGGAVECGLRRCNMEGVPSIRYEDGCRGVEDAGRCEDDFTSSKFPNLDNSNDLLQDGMVDAGNSSFCVGMQSGLAGEFLDPHGEEGKMMDVDYCRAGSPLFVDKGKRDSSEVEGEEEQEDGVHRLSIENPNKRPRTEDWGHSSEFYAAVEQGFSWFEKSKMLYAQKEQELYDAQMQIHYLNGLIHRKVQIIDALESSRMEEQHKRQLEIRHFQQEHNLMSSMVLGYQKALRETREAFMQYRQQFPQGEEPVYKDVGGPGGAVLTARELERRCRELLEMEVQRLRKRDLDNRMVIRMVLDFADSWSCSFERYQADVDALANKLDGLFEGRKFLEGLLLLKARSSLPDAVIQETMSSVLEDEVEEDKSSAPVDVVPEVKRSVSEHLVEANGMISDVGVPEDTDSVLKDEADEMMNPYDVPE